jgi:hypothetical protein
VQHCKLHSICCFCAKTAAAAACGYSDHLQEVAARVHGCSPMVHDLHTPRLFLLGSTLYRTFLQVLASQKLETTTRTETGASFVLSSLLTAMHSARCIVTWGPAACSASSWVRRPNIYVFTDPTSSNAPNDVCWCCTEHPASASRNQTQKSLGLVLLVLTSVASVPQRACHDAFAETI